MRTRRRLETVTIVPSAFTHRAAVDLVALNLATADAVAQTFAAFQARAQELGALLDGVLVQHMFEGNVELLVTAIRDQDFGVIVGCGMGGGTTEIIDVFSRAPIDPAGAGDLLLRLAPCGGCRPSGWYEGWARADSALGQRGRRSAPDR